MSRQYLLEPTGATFHALQKHTYSGYYNLPQYYFMQHFKCQESNLPIMLLPVSHIFYEIQLSATISQIHILYHIFIFMQSSTTMNVNTNIHLLL